MGNALQGEGMSAVCIEKIGTVVEVMQRGQRPGAIVVDPATVLEPGAGELVRYLSGPPGLPVFSISSAAKRVEIAGLLGALRRLEEGDEHAYG